jgi:hypothetical protein
MRELVGVTVDDKLYEFQQFTTTVGLKTLSHLARIIGEPLMLALGVFFKDAPAEGAPKVPFGQREVNTDVLAKAVHALITQLSGEGTDEAIRLIKTLVSGDGVLCDHKKVIFDEHFRGAEGLAHLAKVVRAALEAQYGNFLGAVSAQMSGPAVTAVKGPAVIRR